MRNALLRARRSIPTLAALSVIASTSSGCIAVGGSKHQEPLTLGKQLMDLKCALDVGAMSETEYAAAKAKLLDLATAAAPAR